RASYQTSAFLTTRLALDDAATSRVDSQNARNFQWRDAPMVFQIGTTSPYAFTLSGGDMPYTEPCANDLGHEKCNSVAAPKPELFPELPDPLKRPGVFTAWAVITMIGLLSIALLSSLRVRAAFVGAAEDVTSGTKNQPPVFALILVALLIAAIFCSVWPF